MINTILFDLDGTMLPMKFEKFLEIYFTEMGIFFQDLIEPKVLVKHIWTATAAMINNTEYHTNEKVFCEAFSQLIDNDIDIYMERFDQFYDDAFLKTKAAIVENQLIKDSVAILKEKGYQLVVATNPLFPKKAILHRIQWAGFSPDDFIYITSYEQNHYCKPQIQFFQEILRESGNKSPSQCLMVGNDVQEDMVASKIGIQTYLITDYLIHRSSEDICCNYQGNYEAFYEFVKSLPVVSNISDNRRLFHS